MEPLSGPDRHSYAEWRMSQRPLDSPSVTQTASATANHFQVGQERGVWDPHHSTLCGHLVTERDYKEEERMSTHNILIICTVL